jgi:hypothetical protein
MLTMSRMENIECVWDTGDATPHDTSRIDDLVSFYEDFKARTGATYVARIRWRYEGKSYDCEYPAEVLPDFSAAVVYGATVKLSQPQHYPRQSFLKVLNPDGTLRCHVKAPVIGELSANAERWIRLPGRFSHLGVPFGVPVCYGRYRVVMEVEWTTGVMKRWVLAPNLDR